MLYFLLAVACAFVLTYLIAALARYFKILDIPSGDRHLHSKAVPLLGGLAIFLSFWSVVVLVLIQGKYNLNERQLVFLFFGGLIVMILGFFDDKYKLSARSRLLVSALAVLVVMIGGIKFDGITNPLGGTIGLDMWPIYTTLGRILPIADLLVFFWILGMSYSTKILDGLDGLSTGIAFIGAIMIAALASTAKFYQPDIRILSLIFAGGCLGFLFLNFSPAKIFLGEGGSIFLGLMIGFLAVASGGKIATALLVMAVPVLDLARVIYHRRKIGQPIFSGDREHLHFKLLDMGLSQKQAVLLLYAIAFLFGITTLILPSVYKILVLGFLFLAMIVFEVKISKNIKN